VSLQGDQIVDVSEGLRPVQQRLVDRGLTIVENVPIPGGDKADRTNTMRLSSS